MLPKNIRVEFHGNPWMTQIFDAETNMPITNIKRIEIISDANNCVEEAKLVVDVCETKGTLIAQSKKIDQFSDADLDDLARLILQRIRDQIAISKIDWLKD